MEKVILQGTEFQHYWGEEIRERLFAEIEYLRCELDKLQSGEELSGRWSESQLRRFVRAINKRSSFDEIVNAIRKERMASWYINFGRDGATNAMKAAAGLINGCASKGEYAGTGELI